MTVQVNQEMSAYSSYIDHLMIQLVRDDWLLPSIGTTQAQAASKFLPPTYNHGVLDNPTQNTPTACGEDPASLHGQSNGAGCIGWPRV